MPTIVTADSGESTPMKSGRGGRAIRRVVRFFNPLALPLAGRRHISIWAVIRYRGRISGRAFSAPVAIMRTRDGFVIPMPFGAAQWPLNALAAGHLELHWNGRDYDASSLAVEGETALPAFNAFERAALRAFGIRRFLRLRDVATMDTTIQPDRSATSQA